MATNVTTKVCRRSKQFMKTNRVEVDMIVKFMLIVNQINDVNKH